jgi:hypothetical protein
MKDAIVITDCSAIDLPRDQTIRHRFFPNVFRRLEGENHLVVHHPSLIIAIDWILESRPEMR